MSARSILLVALSLQPPAGSSAAAAWVPTSTRRFAAGSPAPSLSTASGRLRRRSSKLGAERIMPFSVGDLHDLIRLLEERPEWRAEIRRVVLTEDLLRLPEEVARAREETERRFQQLSERIDRLAEWMEQLTARMDQFAARMDQLTERMDQLTEQVTILVGQVGALRGEGMEQRYRTRAFAYFRPLVRRARVLSHDEVAAMLEEAIEAGVLSEEEAQQVFRADVVVSGRRVPDGGSVYLVVEVSAGVGLNDVRRAVERASLLARTGVATLPVVAGEWVVPEAADAARSLHVWLVTDGRVIAPAS
jgi:hypothetical protein